MIKALERISVKRRYGSGSVIFYAGAEARTVLLSLTGVLKAIIYPEDGKQFMLFRAQPGELMGDDQVMRDNYLYTAQVDESGEFAMIDRAQFLNAFSSSEWLLEHSAKRLELMIRNVERLCISAADRRVLAFLMLLNEREGGEVIRISGRMRGFSNELNLTPEATYRALAKLAKNGLIERFSDGNCRLSHAACD